MYSKAIFIFIILLLGLILCSFFSCGKEGMTGTSNPNIDSVSNKIFYGPNGGYAEIINNNGNYYIEIKDAEGNKTHYIYSSTSNTSTSSTNTSTTPSTISTPKIQDITFKGPNDGLATVIVDANGNYTIIIRYSNREKIVYYPDITASGTTTNGNSNSNFQNTLSNYFPSISTPSTYQTNSPTPPPQPYPYPSQPPNPYSSSFQPGIPLNQIPAGDEDLYILKSSVVPPVCPVCPSANCPKNNKDCPACPACARCPEPSFECKKVPNYSQGTQNQLLPMASLNDFTTFGS